VGALLSGFAAAHFGPENALALFGFGMLALVAIVAISSNVARME
jgi:hypothetical protein